MVDERARVTDRVIQRERERERDCLDGGVTERERFRMREREMCIDRDAERVS